MADPSRSEFGDFLRSRRAKLNPKSVGLPDGRRRRAPGLRREEVAELAGIGVDWYIRLEQGRAVSPSVTTIDALARALRLSKVEHAHLRALASGANRLTSRAGAGTCLPGTRLPPRFSPSIVWRKKIATFSSAYFSFRERGACSDQAGPRKPSVSLPSSVRPTISGPAIRRLSNC